MMILQIDMTILRFQVSGVQLRANLRQFVSNSSAVSLRRRRKLQLDEVNMAIRFLSLTYNCHVIAHEFPLNIIYDKFVSNSW